MLTDAEKAFCEQVIAYLEHLEYPELAQLFEEYDIAMLMLMNVKISMLKGQTHRTCALRIYSMTFEMYMRMQRDAVQLIEDVLEQALMNEPCSETQH